MSDNSQEKIPLWRDDRFWRVALQVLAVAIFVALIIWLAINFSRSEQGGRINFSFLNKAASFGIGEGLIPYNPSDPYKQALLVGLVNSLRITVLGIILTTILGIAAGIASFSENWLLKQLNRVYVEVVRNTPLLLQLFFWYFAVFFNLPSQDKRIEWLDSIYMSKSGVILPWPENKLMVWLWLIVLVGGAIASIFIWRWRTKLMVERGVSGRPQLISLIVIGIAALLIIIFALGWQTPKPIETGEIVGGVKLTLEFSALLVGLVFYTGAFIAEIVRGGIEAVSKGQWEAAKSLGLKSGLVMRLVIFPQALRVIIPALNSQYANLAKNSSLAIAIGFPDLYSVANTTYNQAGRPVEVFILLMVTYLSINLIISLTMNYLNKTVQFEER